MRFLRINRLDSVDMQYTILNYNAVNIFNKHIYQSYKFSEYIIKISAAMANDNLLKKSISIIIVNIKIKLKFLHFHIEQNVFKYKLPKFSSDNENLTEENV